ncbi:hypothetical protein N7462_008165 [Penicillium macrosclerotiorum]|uniref:uncharacterized protein n=1 Tax=Penicillium macrosclerotiorum TaxID=303699 RepID=UPI00254925A4|nr:uncharacterized protein N7462_008165 [Penicillium macrosclerotiorum]KAJ5679921.1 hypothetical protein N7462_008165 [Penicillium macrosclerotiorum]
MTTIFLFLMLVSACYASSELPVVDLGYNLHQAFSLNSTSGLYNFSNIRYAAPPVGDLRFRAPVWPEQNRTEVQTGAVGRICPQALPIWTTDIEPQFLLSLLYNTTFNQSTDISSYPYVPAKLDPRTTEDCLFMDVVVPRKIFHRTHGKSFVPRNALAPVLVWLVGGGYVKGDKSSNDPTGLIERSMVVGDGIVYVSINYRLGAFGWLGGEAVIANGTANAALHDQRHALDWVHKNIHLFGGDPARVTVMGESSGGGSLMHQITAYGGKAGPSPFKQAILQSPGWSPVVDEELQEQTFQDFLGILNVSTLDEARNLPTEKLIAGNAKQIATKATWGDFVYGPVVDGSFVPDLPGKLLLQGSFDPNLRVMVGHNANEGLVFTSPAGRNGSALGDLLKIQFPNIKPSVTNFITNDLYPANYSGFYGYTSPFERNAVLLADLAFVCNTDYLNRAYSNHTYAYEFSIPPALHGQDSLYIFYNPGSTGFNAGLSALDVSNGTVAFVLQDYLTSFAQSGHPSSPLGPIFEQYGQRGSLMNIANPAIGPIRDPTDSPRCRFWQTAPFK